MIFSIFKLIINDIFLTRPLTPDGVEGLRRQRPQSPPEPQITAPPPQSRSLLRQYNYPDGAFLERNGIRIGRLDRGRILDLRSKEDNLKTGHELIKDYRILFFFLSIMEYFMDGSRIAPMHTPPPPL